ncbi:hypothetical protein RDWZM_005451 [Blomia tropicalis]|uniref:Uncharacterized protein n=1 Tax=Blomia tropicalis TaxID=40697 RepID=A0A9Q0RMC6_BLOTA|nr:hypothetical protein RDWZM_005451 [Blomia tropicalis]
MGTIVFAGHVIETNKTIWKLIEKYRCENSMLPSIPLPCRMIISNQMFEHNRVTYLVISGSRELFGYILYSYLLTNLPINVYILRRNVFEQQELEEQLLIWLVVLLQLLASMIVFGPLAWCAEVYHSPAKFIPILQPMLRGPRGWLIYKMKYEDLYHRLIDDGPKLAVSIGPNGIFFMLCTITSTIAYAGHVIETNQTIWTLIKKYRNYNSILPSIPLRCRMIISNQLIEHNRVTYLVIAGSRELFAYILYAFLLTNTPINILIIRRNLYEKQELQDQFLLYVIAFIQGFTFFIVFGQLGWTVQVYHSPAKYIPIVQPMLRGTHGWLRYKMKYEDLYHRLTDNGPKLAVSIGTIRAITYMTSCEALKYILLITAFYWMCAKQMDNSALAWNAYVWINVEYVLCIYLAFQCIQNAMFFTFCTITGTIVFCGHVIETNQTVWKLIDKYRSHNSMLSWIPFRCRRIIVNQLVEHNRVTYLVISGSRELFGYVLYAYLLTNIPINVYIIRRNLYETQEFKDQLLLYVIAFLQLLAAIIVFIPLAWCAKIYHSPAMFIPILQPMLRNQHGWLLYKMKYEDLYNRLIDRGPKLAVSIGTLRAITYMASFEVK